MKRQHPTDPNLFWYPKCETYRARDEFHKNKSRKHGIASYCKVCTVIVSSIDYYKHIEREKEYRKSHREEHREYCKRKDQLKKARERAIKYRLTHPNQMIEYRKANPQKVKSWDATRRKKPERKQWEKLYRRKQRKIIANNYIKANLCQRGIVNNRSEITVELIELARHRIIMKRTLKQFKQWRKQNEPNNTDVHGEQFTDEKDHERGISIKSSNVSAT